MEATKYVSEKNTTKHNQEFMEATKRYARQHGFVRTLLGRYRCVCLRRRMTPFGNQIDTHART